MKYYIKDQKDIGVIDNIFNGFHDGFIKKISLECGDYFDKNKDVIINNNYEITIAFAHNNYNKGIPPFNRIIHARFREVKELKIDMGSIGVGEWDIINLKVENSIEKNSFRLGILFPHYNHINKVWENIEKIFFKFCEAEFTEIGNGFTEIQK